jgi:spore coat polysaccharide biosynthesis protein SpsF
MVQALRVKNPPIVTPSGWNPTCIIQARMGSTRLPGKTMKRIEGKTTLERVVERVRRASQIKQVVVATSELEQDDVIVDECERLGVDWFRGSESDVLMRYFEAAQYFKADPIIRVTADCPLIDPGVLNALVVTFRDGKAAFVTNNLEKTFPHGLDAEVFSMDLLGQAVMQTGEDYDHEHVTQWMRAQPGAVNLRCPEDLSSIRITLDTPDDLSLIRAIFRAFKDKEFVTTADVQWLIAHRPELASVADAS